MNLKPNTKEVLTTLATHGRLTAADIAKVLNKPKSTIYDALDEIVGMGLAREEIDGRAKVYSLSSKEQIKEIQKKEVSNIEKIFGEIQKLAEEKPHSVARPRIRFYAGTEGIRQAFMDMPWTSRFSDAYLMWPMEDMMQTLGETFLKAHGVERYKYKVMLHSIRKYTDRTKLHNQFEWLKSDKYSQMREVRYAPKNADWSMSYWVYGDQTLFAGSGSEKFAFIVRSKEFADLMILLWKQMWLQSKE